MLTAVLSNNLLAKILQMLWASAASTVKLQCRRQYGFGDNEVRTSNINLLNDNKLEGHATNNLKTERDIVKTWPRDKGSKEQDQVISGKKVL